MRTLTITEFMSLDGVVENPAWTFPYWNEETAAFKTVETKPSDALLLGRVTYEGFAAAWPKSTDQGAVYFNGARKYVVSNTLKNAEWNNSVIIRNAVEDITRLKQEGDYDLVVHGSVNLAQTLIKHDLVDFYRLLVYPLVLGKGQRLFYEGTTATLELVEARPFSSGVTALIYKPKGK